jgi:hypothetical protein
MLFTLEVKSNMTATVQNISLLFDLVTPTAFKVINMPVHFFENLSWKKNGYIKEK